MQGKKRYFFFSFAPVCLLICRHSPPISSTRNDQVKAGKKKKKSLFSSPNPFLLFMFRPKRKERKKEKVYWQFVRRSKQRERGKGRKIRKMVSCPSIIIAQTPCPASITSTSNYPTTNKQTGFVGCSQTKKKNTLSSKGKALLMQIRTPSLASRLRQRVEKEYVYVWLGTAALCLSPWTELERKVCFLLMCWESVFGSADSTKTRRAVFCLIISALRGTWFNIVLSRVYVVRQGPCSSKKRLISLSLNFFLF